MLLLHTNLCVLLLFGCGRWRWWHIVVGVCWRITYVLGLTVAVDTFFGDQYGFHIGTGHLEHGVQQQVLLQWLKDDDSVRKEYFWKKSEIVITKMDRRPRAPVCRSMANRAMALRASSVNSNVTLSIDRSALYWWSNAFFGSVKILTNISTSRLWNGTNTGKRPTNSCKCTK